jgi:hypothetical protein
VECGNWKVKKTENVVERSGNAVSHAFLSSVYFEHENDLFSISFSSSSLLFPLFETGSLKVVL